MATYDIYNNGKWAVVAVRLPNRRIVARVDSLISGHSDWPIRYDDGRVAWDYPERIPAYVKRITASILDPKPRKDRWVRLTDMEGII